MADTRLTGLSNIGEQLALNDQLYVVNVSDTSQNAAGSSNSTLLNYVLAMLAPCPVRLTLETGVPASIADQATKSTLYATLFGNGNILSLYDGTRLIGDTISADLSLTLSGLTSGKNYDVVCYDSSGTPTLDLMPAWTNDTTRANGVSIQNGFWANSGTITTVINSVSLTAGKGRLLGTIRADGTTTTSDTAATRLVANVQNLLPRGLTSGAGDSHTYATNTEREWNGGSGNLPRSTFLVPIQGPTFLAFGSWRDNSSSTTDNYTMQVALDTTSLQTGTFNQVTGNSGFIAAGLAMNRSGAAIPGIGYHYITLRENVYGGTMNVDGGQTAGIIFI
jgi:hypothetical protein